MLTGHRPARPAMRRRTRRRNRAARIAVPLAIPVALGLTLGIVIAVTGGTHTTSLNQSAFGSRHRFGGRPSASASATSTTTGSASASAGATATASGGAAATGAATVAPAAQFANGQVAFFQLGDLATNPVDGTGAAINMNQTAAEAATSMNCSIAVPANPLSAQGLATPWQPGDGCSMANVGTEGAFVEATILAPDGSLQVYNPLVVTAGTQPAATPAAPTIAAGSAVRPGHRRGGLLPEHGQHRARAEQPGPDG
jgi:hypothetical protein